MQQETTSGIAYLEQMERLRELVAEGRQRLQDQERDTERARGVAVALEQDNARLVELYDAALAALFAAGIDLCECHGDGVRHVAGVTGCDGSRDVHEDRRLLS